LKYEGVVLREDILVLREEKVLLREGKLGGKFGIKGRNSSLPLPALVPP